MKRWEEVCVGDLAAIKHGFAFSGKYITQDATPYVLVTPGSFQIGGGFKLGKYKYFSGHIPNDYILSFDDLIITMTDLSKESDTLGYSAKVPQAEYTFLHNQRIGLIVNMSHKVDKDFLYWTLRTNDYREYILGAATGTSVQHTSPSTISKYKFFLPPLPEQKAIAAVLSSLDDKIDLLHRQNATLEAMAEALFKQWFVVEAKEEWEEKKIGDVLEIKGGTTPKTSVSEYWNGDINWTSPRDLSSTASIFMFDTERKITQKGLDQIGSGLLPVGTLLLSSRAPIGYLAITSIELAINQGYIAIMPNDLLNNMYMYLWCKYYMEDIKAAANGSVFQEISKSVFKQLSLIIPPQSILTVFNKRISPLFESIRANQHQIRTLEKLRDLLLPKLMNGEIRVAY